MIGQTLYTTTLLHGPVTWPMYMSFVAAGIPAFFLAPIFMRSHRLISSILWMLIHAGAYMAIINMISSGYAYTLFLWFSPLAHSGATAILSTSMLDRLQVFVVPALAHGGIASLVCFVIWAILRPAPSRRKSLL